MTHRGYKRPKGKERNDMQPWEGHEAMEVPMGMRMMPDEEMKPKKKKGKRK